MDNKIKVISPEGISGSVPEEDLYEALATEGYTLVDPMQPVRIWTQDGHSGTIPAEDLVEAIKSGTFSNQPVVEQDSAFVDELKRAGKALGRAGLNLADLPTNLLGALQAGSAATPSLYGATEYDMPEPTPEEAELLAQYNIGNYAPSEALKKAGLNLEHNDTTPGQRTRSHVYETAADFVGGGVLGKLAKLAKSPKLGTFLGGDQSLAELGKTGAAVGATAQGLQESGVNPLVSELGASVAAPTAGGLFSRFPKESLTKAQLYPIGLSPQKFNLEAAEAAKRAGIELPAAAYTDSRIMHHLQGILGKSPHFGDIMTAKNAKATEQTKNRIGSILGKVGPEDNEDIRNIISGKYSKAESLLPESAVASPLFTRGATENILEGYKGIPSLSPGSKELHKITQDIHEGFSSPDVWNAIDTKVPVRSLVKQKRELNDMDKLWSDEVKTVNKARNIGRGIGEDIDLYGMQNPEWHKTYKEANKLHGSVEQRKKLEDIFNKAANHGTDTIGYGNLSKIIHDKKSGQKIKKLVGEKGVQEVKDLGETAKAASRKNLNILNPSGSTTTALAAASGYGTLKGLMVDPISTLAAIMGTKRLTNLLTDQKYVDKAIKYAKEAKQPKAPLLPEIAQRIKKTGAYTPGLIAEERREEERRKKLPTITVRNPGNQRAMPEIDLPSIGR